MIRRSTWIILVVFLLLLGGAWLFQQDKEKKAASITPTSSVTNLYNLDEKNVQGLTIHTSSGSELILERDVAGLWALVKPQTEATDVGKAEQAITELLGINILSTLDPAPAKEVVGLDKPGFTITLKLKDGKSKVLQVGKVTPTDSGYYVELDGGPMCVVAKYGLETVIGLIANPPIQPTATAEPPKTPGAAAPGASPQPTRAEPTLPPTVPPTQVMTPTPAPATAAVTETPPTAGSTATP